MKASELESQKCGTYKKAEIYSIVLGYIYLCEVTCLIHQTIPTDNKEMLWIRTKWYYNSI